MTQKDFELKRGFFTVKEFCIDGQIPPDEVAESIIKNHINVLNPIRAKLGLSIVVSQHSGYRPKKWELDHKRDGTSEHTFEDAEGKVTKGAVDVTQDKNIRALLDILILASPYKRICFYSQHNFIHCDYEGKERILYGCESPTSLWKLVRYIAKP